MENQEIYRLSGNSERQTTGLYEFLFPKGIIVLLLLICCTGAAYSQNTGSKIIRFDGSANISNNFYSASGIMPRQKSNMGPGILRANVTLFDQILLPFELYFSTQQTRFQQPFNQFGVSPRFSDWLTVHAGYFTTQMSELSFGDLRMLGGGFELTPGKFRLKAFYGRTRHAAEASLDNYMTGTYKQTAYAMSIGYGDESKTFVNLNVFHAADEAGSITSDFAMVKPNENLVSTLSFGIYFGPKIFFNGEAGISAFSSDITADKTEDFALPEFLFTPNISTRVDGAAKLRVHIMPSDFWSVVLSSQWIGPGFNSLGFALMPNDYMEYAVAPSVRLFNNKLNIRSRAGIRLNNLRNNRLSTTSRFTGSFSANWQVSQKFGFDANYNNNVIQSGHVNDTLRLANVFSSYSFSPRFMFDGLGGANNLMLSYSFQDVSDKNVYTTVVTDNRSHSLSTIHSIAFPSSVSLTTTLLYNTGKLSALNTQIIHVSETVGIRLFKNQVNLSAGVGANFIKTTVNDSQLVLRINASYSPPRFGTLSFNLSNNTYNGTGLITQSYRELFGSLQYNINF
jgi:hypothetical protein